MAQRNPQGSTARRDDYDERGGQGSRNYERQQGSSPSHQRGGVSGNDDDFRDARSEGWTRGSGNGYRDREDVGYYGSQRGEGRGGNYGRSYGDHDDGGYRSEFNEGRGYEPFGVDAGQRDWGGGDYPSRNFGGLRGSMQRLQGGGFSGGRNQQGFNRPAGGYGSYGSTDGSYGDGPSSRQGRDEQFDPDYHQWRTEQMNNLDEDYRSWRDDRYKKFADEFDTWRSSRQGGQQSGQQGTQQSGKASEKSGDNTADQGKQK